MQEKRAAGYFEKNEITFETPSQYAFLTTMEPKMRPDTSNNIPVVIVKVIFVYNVLWSVIISMKKEEF